VPRLNGVIYMTKSRFVLLVGVLGWGVPCALLFSWWMSSSRGTSFWPWLAGLPLWCAGGYAFGLILWKRLGCHRQLQPNQPH
jgi:hypothetical protein